MAACIVCGKSGFFVRVVGGACRSCVARITANAEQHTVGLKKAEQALKRVTMIDTKVSYYEEIARSLQWVAELEARGVAVGVVDRRTGERTGRPAAVELSAMRQEMDDEIAQAMEGEARDAISKARTATGKKRLNGLEKAVARVTEFRAKMASPHRLDPLIDCLLALAQAHQLDELLATGRDAESDGDSEAAKTAYEAALAFLAAQPPTTPVEGWRAGIQARLDALSHGVACRYCTARVRAPATSCSGCGAPTEGATFPSVPGETFTVLAVGTTLPSALPGGVAPPGASGTLPSVTASEAGGPTVHAGVVADQPAKGGCVATLLAILGVLLAVVWFVRHCGGENEDNSRLPADGAQAAPTPPPSPPPPSEATTAVRTTTHTRAPVPRRSPSARPSADPSDPYADP